jgi:hypothetical protein
MQPRYPQRPRRPLPQPRPLLRQQRPRRLHRTHCSPSDGEQCTYEGPSEGVLSEPLSLKLINNSDVGAMGAVLWVPPDLLEEVMPTVGTDFPFSARTAGITNTLQVEAQGGTEASTGAFVPAPGTYVLDCLSSEGATVVHVWRPAAIEFSP